MLGQLRRHEDAPWARFDEDEPAAGRPPSAFDAAPSRPRPPTGLADALAVEDLSDALTAEAAEGPRWSSRSSATSTRTGTPT